MRNDKGSSQSRQHFISTCGRRPKVKTEIAAPYLGLAPVTLEADRMTGRLGIPFHKLGRAIVYDLDELDAWLRARRSRRVKIR
jgi:hypothetical protein